MAVEPCGSAMLASDADEAESVQESVKGVDEDGFGAFFTSPDPAVEGL